MVRKSVREMTGDKRQGRKLVEGKRKNGKGKVQKKKGAKIKESGKREKVERKRTGKKRKKANWQGKVQTVKVNIRKEDRQKKEEGVRGLQNSVLIVFARLVYNVRKQSSNVCSAEVKIVTECTLKRVVSRKSIFLYFVEDRNVAPEKKIQSEDNSFWKI